MRISFAVFCLLLFSCGQQEPQQTSEAVNTTTVYFDTDTVVVWNNDADKLERYRILPLRDSIEKVQALINGINSTYPEMLLLLDTIRHDTLVVSLANAKLLTNQMGNSGAEQYLSFAAMNLLEAKGIHYVQFKLPEGAHARSSVWSIADFQDWKTDTTVTK